MTVLGWAAGISVIGFIIVYDHWIAFILLLVVGGKMIRGASLDQRRRHLLKYFEFSL